MDLEPGWEKKALIVVGIIFVAVVIYAYNPFAGTPTANAQNQSVGTDIPVTTSIPPTMTSNNSTNTTNVTNNVTFQISADVAKNIAMGANPGFTAGTPTQGNITVNNTAFIVWIIPMTQGSTSKNVYVDLSTGVIIKYP